MPTFLPCWQPKWHMHNFCSYSEHSEAILQVIAAPTSIRDRVVTVAICSINLPLVWIAVVLRSPFAVA